MVIGRDVWHLPPDEVVKRPLPLLLETLEMLDAENVGMKAGQRNTLRSKK